MEKQIVSDVSGSGQKNNTFLWIALIIAVAFAVYRGEQQVKIVEVPVKDVAPVVPQAAPQQVAVHNTYPQIVPQQVAEQPAYVSNTRFADIRQQPIDSPRTSSMVLVDSSSHNVTTTIHNNHYTQPQTQTVVVESRPRGQRVMVSQECDDRMQEHLRTVKHWNSQFFPQQ